MSTILEQICEDKRAHVKMCKAKCSLEETESLASAALPPKGFFNSLNQKLINGEFGLITEIKRASPSKGRIRDDFDPTQLANDFQAGGAACLSVLTDTKYFQGDDRHLVDASIAVPLPVLRKDFILDEYQVVESRALGADCILLIMAALDDAQAAELAMCAKAWGMDILIEIHDIKELERALYLDSSLIGINNRNLKTLEVDISLTEKLAPYIPHDRVIVSESGIYTPTDLSRLSRVGAKCFLVGECLMRQSDVKVATSNLLKRESKDCV